MPTVPSCILRLSPTLRTLYLPGVVAGAGAGTAGAAVAGLASAGVVGAGAGATGAGFAADGAAGGASTGLATVGATGVTVTFGAATVGAVAAGGMVTAPVAGAGLPTGTTGATAGVVAALVEASKSFSFASAPCFFEISTPRTMVVKKRIAVSQVVPFCSTLVACAPARLLMASPAKVAPSPSWRGRCMRISRMSRRQTRTSRTVRKLIRMDIKWGANMGG